MERLTRHIYPGLLCGIIIMIICGLPGSYFPKIRTFWEWLGPDKVVHLIMFGVFAFLVIFGYREEYRSRDTRYRTRLTVITLIISMAYGALTEALQLYLFKGRYGSIYDFLADVIGCLLGVFIFRLIFRKKILKN